VLAALLLIWRTELEDQMLQQELSGYLDDARAVQHRLLPGVW
jgi:protein-S-isoprenylcysteine O-methyltransferase Ste14